jgi:hypothetical protein
MRVGVAVTCTVCGNIKAPHGRSALSEMRYCQGFPVDYCRGYLEKPYPGRLWPGETEEDFGYISCTNATREIPE